jgi:Zn-dependent peptidase ImmA (M78 family)
MSRSFSVDINPQVLRWAIERSGFSLDLLSQYIRLRFNVKYFTNEYLEKIIKKQETAQYSDIKKIDSFLKRGVPFYFLDDIPKEKIFPKFRSKYGNFVNPKIEIKLREYAELREEIQFLLQEQKLTINRRLPKYTIENKPIDAAKKIKQLLNFKIEDYKKTNSRELFEVLRNKIEEEDIFIFRDALPHELRGCIFLDNEYPPLILVNSSDDKNAEIFSLLHEFGHFLLDMEDIDIDNINANNPTSQSENWCNSFAYFFLVDGEIEKKEGFMDSNIRERISEQWLKQLSDTYKISKLAFMYRLYILGIITRNEFNDYLKKHKYKQTKGSMGGGNYYTLLKSRHSRRYIQLINNNYFDGKISLSETFNYLKVRDIDRMNQLFEVSPNG